MIFRSAFASTLLAATVFAANAPLPVPPAPAIPDPRHLANGRIIPSEGYADQPYIVQTDDGAWLCVMTTGTGVEGAGAVASAASVVAWLLERSTLRCAPVGDPALLRGLRFDFWANDSRAPALIAIEDVLAYCSASLVPGPDGLELVTWDPCPLLADAEAVIGPAWGCVAEGPMLVEGLDRVVTALEVRYAPRADTGEYTRTLTIGPAAAVPSPGARALVDPVAETAWARWGLRWAEALELPTVWSTATAAEVGRLALRRLALPTATLSYLVPQDLQVLRPGAVVRVEDPDRGLDGQLAWVRSLPRGPGPRRALLQLLPRPEVL
jgi:hypothetical protein